MNERETRAKLPLILASRISQAVNECFESGAIWEEVSPVTSELLHFWFDEEYVEQRECNFHKGQAQAIKNMIYLYEVARVESVGEMYERFYPEAMGEILSELAESSFVKFCIKMATGTGKTWVMNAFVLWQYLNAIYANGYKGIQYFSNFVLLAPGLIVYERLLDSYQGRVGESGSRDVLSSDIMQNAALFVPEMWREKVVEFLSGSVFDKEGKKLEPREAGFLLLSNWHFLDQREERVDERLQEMYPLENVRSIVQGILPLYPSTINDLEKLDRAVKVGEEREYLSKLANLCIINDEAHHIYDDDKDLKWEGIIKYISQAIIKNGGRFMQCDFSATPYIAKTSKKQTSKTHFLHIIVDFDLKRAIHSALVKNISLSKRNFFSSIESLDFRAIRDSDGKVIGLSQGQEIMIDAGLKQLELLEAEFVKLDSSKYPKMLIVCEQQEVVEFVELYLESKGFARESVLGIHSGKQNDIGTQEYMRIKSRLFAMDKHKNPKVVVSVLMLREGFDVSNICVIVPLRASESAILIEQTIGRGLRLMWRDNAGAQMRQENLKALQEGQKPTSYIDHLFIIEHPSFQRFYDEMIREHLVFVDTDEQGGSVAGDWLHIGLKPDYEAYDMAWHRVVSNHTQSSLSERLESILQKPLPHFSAYSLSALKHIAGTKEKFVLENLTTQTQFGGFEISAELFNAGAYNEFLRALCENLSGKLERSGDRISKERGLAVRLQGVEHLLIRRIDKYIRYELFKEGFDPLDSSWRVLCLKDVGEYIIKVFLELLQELESKEESLDTTLESTYFSKVEGFLHKRQFCLDGIKSIYTHTPFPSNKGGLEKTFIEWIQTQGGIVRFIKILESKHNFAYIPYIRADGMFGQYFVDFMAEGEREVYIIETKSQKDMRAEDVLRKKRAAISYVEQVNAALAARGQKPWRYVLVGENSLHSIIARGGGLDELVSLCGGK